MHLLQVVEGPDHGTRFRLPPNEPQLIGRSSEALPFADQTISRRHAELTPDDGRWYLRDLESANGTFVNDEAIEGRVELSPGDLIRCGSTVLAFEAIPDDAAPNPIRILGPDEMDATVEHALAPDDPAGGTAAPDDPLHAAQEHLRVVYELTSLTSSVIDRTTLLERVMDLIFREFRPERGFVLLQEGPRSIPAVVRHRRPPRTLDEGHIPVSRTIVDHVLHHGEGILATNAMNDDRFRSGDSVREYGIRTAICVPIRAGERLFGVIHMDSSMADFTWTEDELRLMNAIGQHTGLALNAAELLAAKLQGERLAAMGEAVASLSHSIRNILQGLRGGADAVELALNRGDLEHAREGWPILARNLDRIYQLTLNMLAWSKQRTVDIDLVPLGPLLEEVAELVRPMADRREVSVTVDLDEHMPPVPIDANAVHQAAMNLVTNAIEAAPSRSGAVRIGTRYDDASRSAEIHVEDNGAGVPLELLDRIFEPFMSTKGQRGTGLGLAVTRKIAEEHGGAISATAADTGGTRFTLTLPCDDRSVDSGRTHLPRAAEPGQVQPEDEFE